MENAETAKTARLNMWDRFAAYMEEVHKTVRGYHAETCLDKYLRTTGCEVYSNTEEGGTEVDFIVWAKNGPANVKLGETFDLKHEEQMLIEVTTKTYSRHALIERIAQVQKNAELFAKFYGAIKYKVIAFNGPDENNILRWLHHCSTRSQEDVHFIGFIADAASELSEHIQNLKSSAADRESDVTQMSAQVALLTTELTDRNRKHALEVAKLQNQLRHFHNEMEGMKAEHREEMELLRAEVKALQSQMTHGTTEPHYSVGKEKMRAFAPPTGHTNPKYDTSSSSAPQRYSSYRGGRRGGY